MPIGQPFTDDDKEAFLELIASKGKSIATAAMEIGFSPRTVKRHLQDDADFRAMLEEAEDIALGRVEDVVYEEATKHHSAWAVKMWLTNRAPRGRWVDDRSPAAGQVGGGGGNQPAIIVAAIREAVMAPDSHAVAVNALTSVPLPIEAEARESA